MTKLILALASTLLLAGILVAESGFISTPDGAELYYEVHGAGPDLVILNGAQKSEAISVLREGFRVIAFHGRARGRSSRMTADLAVTMTLDLEDLELLIQELRLKDPVVYGGSYYGAVVARHAARFPDSVSKIILEGAMPPHHEIWDRAQEGQEPKEPSVEDLRVEVLRTHTLEDREPEAFCREYYRAAALNLYYDPVKAKGMDLGFCDYPNEWPINFSKWIGAIFASIPEWDFREDLASLEIPALVIQGRDDAIVPPESGPEWADHLVNAKLLLVERAGHIPSRDHPDRVLGAIREFASGVKPKLSGNR